MLRYNLPSDLKGKKKGKERTRGGTTRRKKITADFHQ
jgi:hypothetical protein